ncbi:SSU ribosomal protein S20P [Limimonas halophila]|uniref:Small ribosomal subunit protein bS20 n=1 Tax=Limimonas halophila TaxID=1082479 RepID=A0A1G7VAP6_9PROT|nr:30S ribosomal protein S20 [Limimonas halophila]SDG56621.1 SSU ribosomal protein S20P [Limimonas halophila]
MAHTKQSRKRVRRNRTRYAINHARKSRVRTFVKHVESAIARGDGQAARQALDTAAPEMRRAVNKGVIHKNAAARKISRLTRRVNALG